jgi:hypothetical protein
MQYLLYLSKTPGCSRVKCRMAAQSIFFFFRNVLKLSYVIPSIIYPRAASKLPPVMSVRHPKQHPTHIQTSMTLPTRPQAIFSIPPMAGPGTRNPDTKPTLQRAENTNAQPTPADGILFSFILNINKTAAISKPSQLKNQTVCIAIKYVK